MDASRRKELKNNYRSKPVLGGICCIRCSGNQREFIQATTNIEGLKNRFDFAMAIRSCPDPTMYNEWLEFGGESFSFTILEEMKKGEDQTDAEFSSDIDALYAIWRENHGEGASAFTK